MDWASNLVVFDSIRAINYDSWRLPVASDVWVNVDPNTDVRTEAHDVGEMEALFYELGGTWNQNLFTVSPASPYMSFFPVLQTGWYWGRSVDHVKSGDHQAFFSFDQGNTSHDGQSSSRDCGQCHDFNQPEPLPYIHALTNNNYYALAVMDGDVSAVPIPSSIILMGLGLAGLSLVRRKK